jgi:hypothetical protein
VCMTTRCCCVIVTFLIQEAQCSVMKLMMTESLLGLCGHIYFKTDHDYFIILPSSSFSRLILHNTCSGQIRKKQYLNHIRDSSVCLNWTQILLGLVELKFICDV